MDTPREEWAVSSQIDDEPEESGGPFQTRTSRTAASDLPEFERILDHVFMIRGSEGTGPLRPRQDVEAGPGALWTNPKPSSAYGSSNVASTLPARIARLRAVWSLSFSSA